MGGSLGAGVVRVGGLRRVRWCRYRGLMRWCGGGCEAGYGCGAACF